MALQSATPNNMQRAGANKRNLLAIIGVTAVAVGLAVSYNVPWTSTTPVKVEAQQVEAGTLAVGSVFNFNTDHGNVALTVASLDGDIAVVTDSEGDRITISTAQLTGGTLPASDTDAAAARNLRRVQCYAEQGAYAAMKGVSGPVPTVAACHD